MQLLRLGTNAVVYVFAVLAGVPVTGLVLADFTTLLSKNGAAAASVTPTACVEVSVAGAPGVYALTLDGDDIDTPGEVLLAAYSGTAAFDPYAARAQVTALDQLDAMQALLELIRGLSAGVRVVDTTTHDAFGNLLTARIRRFDVGADVDVDSPVITVQATGTYDGSGRLTELLEEEV